jgi:hypothetical protein
VHRRVIVAIDRIREIQPLANGDSTLILQDRHTMRASRSYRETVRKRWAQFHGLAKYARPCADCNRAHVHTSHANRRSRCRSSRGFGTLLWSRKRKRRTTRRQHVRFDDRMTHAVGRAFQQIHRGPLAQRCVRVGMERAHILLAIALRISSADIAERSATVRRRRRSDRWRDEQAFGRIRDAASSCSVKWT